jgi:hypothetical protein
MGVPTGASSPSLQTASDGDQAPGLSFPWSGGRDTSWHALLMHLSQKAAHMQANQQLTEDVTSVTRAWASIRRFRHTGVLTRTPLQLVFDPRATPAHWLVPKRMGKNPAWLEPLCRVLCVVEMLRLFSRLNRGEDVPEAAVHQSLLHDVIHGLKRRDVPIGSLFADERWRLVRSSAQRRSWLSVLCKNGFPCREEEEAAGSVDPVGDLVEIGQFTEPDRDQLPTLTLWLATSMRSHRDEDVIMADLSPLAWAPVRLSTEHVEFDTCSMEMDVQVHGAFEIISNDGLTRIDRCAFKSNILISYCECSSNTCNSILAKRKIHNPSVTMYLTKQIACLY